MTRSNVKGGEKDQVDLVQMREDEKVSLYTRVYSAICGFGLDIGEFSAVD